MTTKILVAAIGLAFSGAALAEGFYVGVGALRGHLAVPTISGTLQGVAVTGSGDTTTRTGYKLFGGYNFNQNLGVEFAYNDLGSGYSLKGTAAGIPFNITGMKGYNYQLAAVGQVPLSSQLSIFGKIGVASNHTNGGTASVAGVTWSIGSASRSQAMYGIGADYSFSRNWAARIEYENYGKLSKDDFWSTGSSGGALKGSAWSLSAKYSY